MKVKVPDEYRGFLSDDDWEELKKEYEGLPITQNAIATYLMRKFRKEHMHPVEMKDEDES